MVNPFAASEWIIHDLLTPTGYASTISDSKLVVKATTSLRSGSGTLNVSSVTDRQRMQHRTACFRCVYGKERGRDPDKLTCSPGSTCGLLQANRDACFAVKLPIYDRTQGSDGNRTNSRCDVGWYRRVWLRPHTALSAVCST
jgi:hypothetical protein